MLARHRARATFFMVGRSAEAHPRLVASVVAAGHEVANHTWSHPSLVGLPAAAVADELARTTATLRAAGAEPLLLLRPPRGEQDEVSAEAACRAGYRTVGWSVNIERHVGDPEALAAAVGPGTLVLAHDGRVDRTRSIAALARFLAALADRGVAVVGIGELLGVTMAEGAPA